jgi:NADH:ubiquinone oxidoreductase subunit 3 (subunit A)
VDQFKITNYECGFDLFQDRRLPINNFFYKLAIIFIILDIELLYLFPLSFSLQIALRKDSIYFLVFIGFIFLLLISFFYEILTGSLFVFIYLVRYGYKHDAKYLSELYENVRKIKTNKISLFFIFADYSEYFNLIKNNLGFQKPITPYMVGIEDLHHYIMSILIFIFIFVFYFIILIVLKFSKKKQKEPLFDFYQHSLLEIY